MLAIINPDPQGRGFPARRVPHPSLAKSPIAASSEPETEVEIELAEVVAHSAPRTLPISAQIPEAIHFPAKRTLDDAPRSLGYPGNAIC
jgi:hypothetical protein